MSETTLSPTVVVDTSRSPHALLRPVPITGVTLTDNFWAPRQRINREATIPSQYKQCEDTGRLDNFRRASRKKDIPFEGIYFNDSDVYKWLEAAAYSLATHPEDEAVRAMVDEVVTQIVDAQDISGYLNTYFSVDRVAERWTNLRDMHELYCAGHLFQAAVAHYRATGTTRLLEVATRFADHICDVFGPDTRPGACGHEEVEMGLVELYRATANTRYLAQAQFFIDMRGQEPSALTKNTAEQQFDRRYYQDHAPFRDQNEVTGHAVRMVYLSAGATDVYTETGEAALKLAVDKQWENLTTRRMYVTGGLGSRWEGEAFGTDWELPSGRAYTETCAAIGCMMWNWRLLQLTGEPQYADLLELALYNGMLAGLSLDGMQYFYQNPLSDSGAHRREAWFGCACCPPNVARTLASLSGYFASTSQDGLWLHLYAASTITVALPSSETISLAVKTEYPWDGVVDIEVADAPSAPYTLYLRIPSWADGATVTVKNASGTESVAPGSYAELRRNWKPGDTIRLTLPMAVRQITGHPYVADTGGRVALARGPLVYCIEQADHEGTDIRDLQLSSDTNLSADFLANKLGGIVVLRGTAISVDNQAWDGKLYQVANTSTTPSMQTVALTAIPYYAWANREPGPMTVWIPRSTTE